MHQCACTSDITHLSYLLFPFFFWWLCGKGHFAGEQGDAASLSYLSALISLVRKHQRDYLFAVCRVVAVRGRAGDAACGQCGSIVMAVFFCLY